MSFRRGRTRNYGELSQPGRGTTPGNHQSRERSLSPDGRPTPLSHPSNPVRFRSQTARPGTPTAVSSDGQSPSSAFALESRTVSASSDRSTTSSITLELPSLGFPPNLANARHRIASNSSVHSSASVGSGTSVGSYLAGPRVYQPGFSPLEACLPVYPVISQILRYLSTRYILPLHTVSKAFKAYMDSTYISHWSELVLCKERQWIPCVYTPRTARERVELETVYRHIRQYVYWRVDEEERALKNVRNRYDYEVAFMLDRELCLESKFVSGGRRTIWDIKYQRERNVRRSIIGGSRLEFEPGEIAYRKEITRPRVFFNKGVHGNHITRAMMFAATQLQRAVNPQNMSPLQFVKTLVIDGSNIDMPSLAVALDLSQVNGRGRLEALSACACTNLNLVRWARYLESSPRALRQLKSLRIYPNEHFPIAPFHYDATKSLLRLYRRANIPHDLHNPPVFPTKLTLEEHLNITIPLITSNSPNDSNNTPGLDVHKLRADSLAGSRLTLRDAYEDQQRALGRWMRGPYISHLHPALKIMALCQARGVQLNFNLCASGSKCFGWKLVKDRRAVGRLAADEDLALTTHTINSDPENIGTHVIGSRIRGEKKGTRECACCGAWEWAYGNQARKSGWLKEALGLPEDWAVEEDGGISLIEPLKPEVKLSFRMIFGPDIPFQETGKNEYDREDHRCRELMKDVGGVKMPVLLKRKEIRALDNFGNLGEVINIYNEWYTYPAGCGAGGICGDCEMNLTCWGCGKFYCQICSFIPNPRRTTVCALPMHLRMLCPDRKHGPLCIGCYPKLNTTCGTCRGSYCNVCFPAGIRLQKKWNHGDPYKLLPDSGADEIWEEWDDTDHLGREIHAIGRDEDRPPSEPEEWDISAGEQEIVAANEAENSELLVVQGGAEQVVTTVGDVVSQLQEMRVRVGDEALDLGTGQLPLDNHADGPGPENEGDMASNSHVDQSPEGEETPDGQGAHEISRQLASLLPDVSGHPTLISYTTEVPAFPSVQAYHIAKIPLQNPPKDLDFDLKNYEPVQIHTTCDFCTMAVCAVCSHGKGKLKNNWEYDRCGGCGGRMCPECCYQACSACQRGLCQQCDQREREQLAPRALALLFPHLPNLYETGDDGTVIYSCLRCMLRRGIGLTKAVAKAINPHGPPVDGYGRQVDTNGLVDPRPGLQIVREQLRREFDPGNREALVGTMEGITGGEGGLSGEPDGNETRAGLGLLLQDVGTGSGRGTAREMASGHWWSGADTENDTEWMQGEDQGEEDWEGYGHEEDEEEAPMELAFL